MRKKYTGRIIPQRLVMLLFMATQSLFCSLYAADPVNVMYGDPIFEETFGQGWGVWGSLESAGLSPLGKIDRYVGYGETQAGGSTNVNDGNNNLPARVFNYSDFSITNNLDYLRSCYHQSHDNWIIANFYDHTGDHDGRMFVADGGQRPGSIYERRITELCRNAEFEFSAWVASLHNSTDNGPNFQVEIWSKNPSKGINDVIDKMGDWQIPTYMSSFSVGMKVASDDGGSAELLGILSEKNQTATTGKVNLDEWHTLEKGDLEAKGEMFIYEHGIDIGYANYTNPITGHQMDKDERHRYKVYYSNTLKTYVCQEWGQTGPINKDTYFYAEKNTSPNTYQNKEMFKRGSKLNGLGACETNYIVPYFENGTEKYYPVYAYSGLGEDGKPTSDGTTRLYFYIDKDGEKWRLNVQATMLTMNEGTVYQKEIPFWFPIVKDDCTKGYNTSVSSGFKNMSSNEYIYSNTFQQNNANSFESTYYKMLTNRIDGNSSSYMCVYYRENPGDMVMNNYQSMADGSWNNTETASYSHQIYYVEYKRYGVHKWGRWYPTYTDCKMKVTDQCKEEFNVTIDNNLELDSNFVYEGDLSTQKRWQQIKTTFKLGNQESVYLVFRDFDANTNGNDMAVDDIVFRPYANYTMNIKLSESSKTTACSDGVVTITSNIEADEDQRAEIEAALKNYGFFFEGKPYGSDDWIAINTVAYQIQSMDDLLELNLPLAEYNEYEKIRTVARSAVSINSKCKTMSSKIFEHQDLGNAPLFNVSGDDMCIDNPGDLDNQQIKGRFKITNTNQKNGEAWRVRVRLSDGTVTTLSPKQVACP